MNTKYIYRHCEGGVGGDDDNESHWKCAGYGNEGECGCECHASKPMNTQHPLEEELWPEDLEMKNALEYQRIDLALKNAQIDHDYEMNLEKQRIENETTRLQDSSR